MNQLSPSFLTFNHQGLWPSFTPRTNLQNNLLVGLVKKKSGFSYLSLEWMSNLLSHRKECARLNGTESTWLAPRSGIPQRRVLGPMLLKIFDSSPMIYLLNLKVIVLVLRMTHWLVVSHSQTEHLSCGTCFPGRCKPPVPC